MTDEHLQNGEEAEEKKAPTQKFKELSVFAYYVP